MTAAEAKEKTFERIRVIAKEFVLNTVNPAIQNAINEGRFKTNVLIRDLPSRVAAATEIEKLLREKGFEVEFIAQHGVGEYFSINWGD